MKHVISIENAKKFQELGVVAESCFKHYLTSDGWIVDPSHRFDWSNGEIPAYSVGELGEMLPDDCDLVLQSRIAEMRNRLQEHCVLPPKITTKEALISPDIVAGWVIWLIENGHIKAGEL